MKDGYKSREYGRNMPQWLKALLFALIATIILFALKECVTGNKTKAGTHGTDLKRMNAAWNKRAIDSCIAMLQQGDMVIRSGRDITSQMFMKFNQTDKTYSHCGLVMIENGYPFVYHSIGGEDNPDAKLRRDSASFWFSPVYNTGLGICRFDFADSNHKALTAIVKKYYKERRMFDMSFDLSTDDRLYCAEFVYKAVNQAVADSSYIKPVTLFGLRLVAIDNLYKNRHTSLVCQVRYK